MKIKLNVTLSHFTKEPLTCDPGQVEKAVPRPAFFLIVTLHTSCNPMHGTACIFLAHTGLHIASQTMLKLISLQTPNLLT
jgi:hypothetical protein